ncbi:EthD family reductase [Marimonas arenosa]|uniref:EthD family reductase n=1 Tax=Marimonas arenosa TaxID=1795305 RepID=A0AAE3WE34_9RHOB|nr:EthD family reductase [Marimonas arenosa]MDQ2091316.1 EthD family reductase [Marimonas arenosa]
MTVSLQVAHPAADGTTFDYDYYLSTHMALVDEYMGPHIKSTLVTKGLAGGPDTPPPFHAIATIVFADQATMDAALAASDPVLKDIPNFTDSTPQILIGEVVG